MLYCTHSRTHYCFLLTSTIWESLLDRNHCFGRPSPAAVSQLKHAHPQQVVPHCEIFMSDWPHMHVQAHVLITLSCTSEEGEGSGLALTHAACETQAGLTLCADSFQSQPAVKQDDFPLLLPYLFLLQGSLHMPSTTRSCLGLHVQITIFRALGLFCKPTHTVHSTKIQMNFCILN